MTIPDDVLLRQIATAFDPGDAGRANLLAIADRLSAQREICICAAVRAKDGTVIRGHRHADALRAAVNARLVLDYDAPHQGQGFVTSRNRFVDRAEGMRIQRAAGAASAARPDGVLRGDILFSEDLY